MKKPHTQVRYSWNENDFKFTGDPSEFKKKPKNIVLPNYIEELKIQEPIGEPVGTSDYFIDKMQQATIKYFRERNGIQIEDLSLISLSGEGKIEDRVDSLYSQLNNYMDKIQEADLVLFVAHSQGTPVTALIIERLIENNIINTKKQRTGMMAMAGISHGPYPNLKQSLVIKYVENENAKQLFDFNDPNAKITIAYYKALEYILSNGVRISAVGSWYDQVVPLYSATLQGINHPNVFRALYIHAQDYQPDFLSHLVVFGLKLRNKGLTDYGLITQLSDYLAGNIYGFGTQGHSAIYEELDTYYVSLSWIMGQNKLWDLQQEEIASKFKAPYKTNPFNLPWIIAKLTSDENIKKDQELSNDLKELQELFKIWIPNSQLKELKYSLEMFKAKL
ncbi:hypothetical protein HDV04_001256 [Boothiomyces sp. JEL0838]|nr:hypothetical protein HDV04_001256 [Boothiomyces sp. JEL0838]